MPEIRLGSRLITPTSAPYVIAEIGVNHEGSLERAKRLIKLAKEGGACAAKFQSYKADTIASKNSPAYWDTSKEKCENQHELFKKYDSFNDAEYIELAQYCKSLNIDFLSTPFDNNAVDFLDPLIPFYKIASADITNTPLLRAIARKNKPVVLSTGASNIDEIHTAIGILVEEGCIEMALLHCVLNYPTPDQNAHLNMILGLKYSFPSLIIGYSDHTVPNNEMTALFMAYVLGAQIIEKHFTDDKTKLGNDHYHAMDRDDLKRFIAQVRKSKELSGDSEKRALESEAPSREHARRSIVTVGELKAGTVLTETMLIPKRPAHGISPLQWDQIVGKTIAKDLPDDHILRLEDLS
jgi:sialic acid synthase SpsE